MQTKKQKFFEEFIEPDLVEYGIDPKSVIDYPKNTRELKDVKYVCACGNHTSKKYKPFKISPLCETCAPKLKRGPKTFGIEKFEELALLHGYKVTPREGEVYNNVKSRITVTNIETGETHTSSYSSFRDGHCHSHHHASLQKTLSLAEVKKRVKKAGFVWVEGTVYTYNNVPIKVLCHCGDEYMVAVVNLHEDRVGCEKCYMYRRNNPWQDIEGLADKYHCKMITQEKDYKGRISTIWFICSCGNSCSKTAKSFLKSSWCDDCADNLRKETNLKKYGAECYLASDDGKQKTENHWVTNYNVKHNMQVKAIQEKAQATCEKNHGVKWVIGLEENEERRFKALMAKYGSNTTLHTEQFKKTMRERYGCEHNMQHAETFAKMCKARYKLKKYVFPSGRIEYVQGYEPRCLNYLLTVEKIDEDDIVVHPDDVPMIYYEHNGEIHRYYMDIYIKSEDRAIEVKAPYTYKNDRDVNEAKWVTTSKLHACIEVYIFDPKYKEQFGFVLSKQMIDGDVASFSFNHRDKQIPLDTIY